MDGIVVQVAVFLPVLVVVALTVFAFGRMAVARARCAKERDMSYYKTYLGPPEPDYAIVAVRHYGNVLELPTLFYAGCIVAFAMNAVTMWVLVWAWGFAIFRVLQSAIHLTYNNPAHRGISFSVSWLFLIALWVTDAMAIFARL